MSGFRWFSFRRKRDTDLDEEIRTHLSMAAREKIEQGNTPEQAASEARREFGNVGLVKETTRAAWGWHSLETLTQDVRYAFRSLKSSPAFTLIAVGSLALGIGANTAIFSFVNALLLKHLPVPEPTRLVDLAEYERGRVVNTVFSFPFIEELNKRDSAFDGVLGRFPVRVNLTSDPIAEPLNGEVVTGGYFKTLQVKPALGRLLTEEDIDAAPGNPVCVISYSLWQQRFGADPHIVGRKLMLNSHPYTIIGVTQKGFNGPQLQSRRDMQLPVSRMGDFMGGFLASGPGGKMWKAAGFYWLEPLARLKPGITTARAKAVTDSVARAIKMQLESSGPGPKVDWAKRTYRLSDGSQGVQEDTSYFKPLTVLMAVVALVLLIACVNLANLLIARAVARSKECAVRLSVGAGRWRLIRQFMTESLVIAACGGLLGIGLAFWIMHTLLLFLDAGRSQGSWLDVSVDPFTITFSILLSLLTAFLFGLLPAWQSTRPDVISELKGTPGQAEGKLAGFRIRRVLIVSEIALALVILVSAGLLTQTLSRLKTIDLGFNPERVLTLKIDPAMNGYTLAQSEQVFDEILSRLRAQPGIADASLATVSPLEGGMISLPLEVPGHKQKSSDRQTNFNMVSPRYFNTLNQKLLAGRDFTDSDVKKTQGVAIVNQLFVDQYMPGVNPIGRQIKAGGSVDVIVGVVKNARYQSLREQPWPLVHLPVKQTTSSGYTLLVRTQAESSRAVSNIERTIHSIAPRLRIYDVFELQATIDQGISAERVLSFLSTLFSALATLLCGIGIYGVIAYAVSRRTREIGLRFAVGAQKTDVAGLFLRESVFLISAGILIGIPLALASTRLLKSLLYGVEPRDPITLVIAIAIFAVAGLLASLLPVWKAARIEVVSALRYE